MVSLKAKAAVTVPLRKYDAIPTSYPASTSFRSSTPTSEPEVQNDIPISFPLLELPEILAPASREPTPESQARVQNIIQRLQRLDEPRRSKGSVDGKVYPDQNFGDGVGYWIMTSKLALGMLEKSPWSLDVDDGGKGGSDEEEEEEEDAAPELDDIPATVDEWEAYESAVRARQERIKRRKEAKRNKGKDRGAHNRTESASSKEHANAGRTTPHGQPQRRVLVPASPLASPISPRKLHAPTEHVSSPVREEDGDELLSPRRKRKSSASSSGPEIPPERPSSRKRRHEGLRRVESEVVREVGYDGDVQIVGGTNPSNPSLPYPPPSFTGGFTTSTPYLQRNPPLASLPTQSIAASVSTNEGNQNGKKNGTPSTSSVPLKGTDGTNEESSGKPQSHSPHTKARARTHSAIFVASSSCSSMSLCPTTTQPNYATQTTKNLSPPQREQVKTATAIATVKPISSIPTSSQLGPFHTNHDRKQSTGGGLDGRALSKPSGSSSAGFENASQFDLSQAVNDITGFLKDDLT